MNLLGDIQEVVVVIEQLTALSSNGQIQADISALIADAQQLKVLAASVVGTVTDIVEQLSPELKALFPQVVAPAGSTVTSTSTTTVTAPPSA